MSFQDILPLVEKPSRYLGSEINTIKKSVSDVKLSVVLAFPDLYEIGTSHFGLQILYTILNKRTEITAERVFAPASDMEGYLRASNTPLMSMESKRPLTDFDIIGFSLLYELNYTNVLSILDLAKIPFYSRHRDVDQPLIIAGGPCTCNPEPVAEFFDAMVIGDGETVILDICRVWSVWKKGADNRQKDILLKRLAGIKGVYIPQFYKLRCKTLGLPVSHSLETENNVVKRAVLPDLETAPFPRDPIIPFGRPVHDRLRLEVARGCTRGCRFCQAGMIYRPVRERSIQNIISICDDSIRTTGYEDLSLLSLSTGDYGCIGSLLEQLMNRYGKSHHAVSFPSMRVGTLTPELMRLVKKVRKTGFTIAPEAGSQRLRDVINKNICDEDILYTTREVFSHGWQVIKLYFMIGLPTEVDDDLDAILRLIRNIRAQHGLKKRRLRLNISVATFVPKPHTPFQWQPQISLATSKKKISWLREKLKEPGIHFKWQNPEVSFIEGLWARGDRRLSELLVNAYQKGCRFDGWSDHFNFGLWEDAIHESDIDMDYYTSRRRDLDEQLPWDHINIGVSKKFLKNEWKKSIQGEPTGDCRGGKCNLCGVCNFKHIEPKVFTECSDIQDAKTHTIQDKAVVYTKFIIKYSKLDKGRFFGHLELVNIFTRAIRRAEIPIKYSEGFHPKPKISFYDPLPIGMESLNEIMIIDAAQHIKPERIRRRINNRLPEGIIIRECKIAQNKKRFKPQEKVSYRVHLKNNQFDLKKLSIFRSKATFELTIKNKKGGERTIDLKKQILKMETIDRSTLNVKVKNESGIMVRPSMILKNLFGLHDEDIQQARVLKFSDMVDQ